MKMLRILLAALCAVLMSVQAWAQEYEFLWEVGFDSRFDNREYGSRLAADGTIFGARLSPQVGLGWGYGNAIMAGVDLRADFGQKDFPTPEAVFYYRYSGSRFNAFAGIVPRRNMIGGYPTAFFSDSIRFYDNNIEGVLLQYHGRRGFFELGCDWNSKVQGEQREKFMVFMAGQINFILDTWKMVTPHNKYRSNNTLYAGFNMNMYHHAGSETERGVVDNILLYPYVGVALGRLTGMSELSLSVGWLQAFQNDRRYIGEYVTPGGIQIDARAEKWGVGISNSLYLGGNLMPYYTSTIAEQPSYGDGLYYGEPFFRTDSGVYNRFELYWEPVFKGNFKVHIGSVFHYDGSVVAWQQVLSLQLTIF